MNATTKQAVERFLMDSNMFHRTFGNDDLIASDEWLRFESLKAEQAEATVDNDRVLLSVNLNIFLEDVYSRISNFIPIQLDNIAEFHIFLDMAQVFRRHLRDILTE